jgi:flagellar assembly protein FliH
MSNEGASKIISGGKSSEFQAWELPNVDFVEDSDINTDVEEEEILPMLTADELEKIHQQAYSEGYEEGKLKGIKEGFEEGDKEGKKQGQQQAYDDTLTTIKEQIEYFEKINQSLQAPLDQTSEQVEHELMELVFSLAKHIIQEELKIHPEHVVSLLKQSLDLLPSASKNIKIYLNPLDVELVKNAFSKCEDSYSDNTGFEDYKILNYSKIERGGCIVDTNISHIDASIETRIELLAEKLIPPEIDLKADIDQEIIDSENKQDKPLEEKPVTETVVDEVNDSPDPSLNLKD